MQNLDTTKEVSSLEESLKILEKYKDQISDKSYKNIRSTIGSYAIENIYVNEKNIIDMINALKCKEINE